MKASRRRPVLVVSHEASRTGAPRIALEVVRALCPVGNPRLVVLRWGGPLTSAFRAEADRVLFEPFRHLRVVLRRFRRTRRLAIGVEILAAAAVVALRRPELVYLNTVKSACYIRPALWLGRPLVLHVHELNPLVADTLARYRLDAVRHWSRVHLVACSTAARDDLCAASGVSSSRITVIPSVIDREEVTRRSRDHPTAGIVASGRPVVGACGTADEGKGVDLFLSVARRVCAEAGDTRPRFVWVGRHAPDIQSEVTRLGLAGDVSFLGELANPLPEVAAMDVYTHAARQDAFGVAVLEAMALSRPIVAFDVGGLRELLGDAGILVPTLDPDAMATAVLALLRDPVARKELGERAQERAAKQWDVDVLRRSVRAVALSAMGRRGVDPG